MSSDIEELLANGMARYAGTIPERGGLVHAARTRLRRRRIVRAAAAAGTALAVAIGAVALANHGTQGQPRMLTDAYVIKKIQSALSSADANDGLVMYAVLSDPVVRGVIKNWDYRDAGVTQLPGVRGPLITGYSVTGDRVTWTSVDYSARTWEKARTEQDNVLPRSLPDDGQYQILPPCSAAESGVGIGGINWPGYLRSELACGAFHYEGYTTLGGMRVIELAAETKRTRYGYVSETLWVDPRTYLPVRAVSQIKIGTVPPGFLEPGTYDPSITTFQWLPPSPANLARLKVTIPSGFRQVN